MTLVEREAPSHWYHRDGRPFHEIPKRDGSGMRPVTVADARKALALPSVTNVLGVISKPGLEGWKIEQAILSALTLPPQPGEELGLFAKRVVKDMGDQVAKACDFGTIIHAACELYAREKIVPQDPTLRKFFEPWREWFDGNVERVASIEDVLVNERFGYAGRVDMIAKLRGIGWAVVDFKTQKVRRSPSGEPRPAFYETWPLQLAAYQKAVEASGKSAPGLVSVVIDSSEPGPVHVKAWGADSPSTSPAEHFRLFVAALVLWRYVKAYDPGMPGLNASIKPELN